MAQPKAYEEAYEGTPEELEQYLKRQPPQQRFRVTRVLPGEASPCLDEATSPSSGECDKNRHEAERPSALGKYAFVPGGSEEFAREKQQEIEREDRPRS